MDQFLYDRILSVTGYVVNIINCKDPRRALMKLIGLEFGKFKNLQIESYLDFW